MAFETLRFDVSDRIATVTVNRPDKLNALNTTVMHELRDAVEQIRTRDDVGGAIVTGEGAKAFVAGADIAELSGLGPVEAREHARFGQETFSALERLPKPVIAAVNGFALGGGCELALACHLRIAAEGARFGLPEVKLGLCPGYGGTQRLPRLVGRGRALELMLTGRMIDAAEAHRIGLANHVVPAAELMDAARALLGQMLANGPLGLAACIDAANRGTESSLDAGLALELGHFGLLASTADMREGTAAFLEKRPAKFTGA